MTDFPFSVTEHVVEGQYIREYPHATQRQEDAVKLAVKEYRPLARDASRPGPVTIIAAHANGFVKEMYEPLWEELVKRVPFEVEAIWIADCAWQGHSSALNEASWMDHSRDLLQVVNTFRDRMPRPIFGIGHSLGAGQLLQLSLLHPRLLHALAAIEPVVVPRPPLSSNNLTALSSKRRDIWPSRSEAEAAIMRAPMFKAMEARVSRLYVKHGLRDVPTALYPDAPAGAVTLTTSKHQEVWTFLRSNLGSQAGWEEDGVGRAVARQLHPDVDWELVGREQQFYRPEPLRIYANLPFVRPSVLYLLGAESYVSAPDIVDGRAARTGSGVGGSGGMEEGRVKEIFMEGAGHLVPFERVAATAELLADWLGDRFRDWQQIEEQLGTYDTKKSRDGRLRVSDEWLTAVKSPRPQVKSVKEKL